MSVHMVDWRRAGCGDACMPRQHDPEAHEAHGRLLEQWDSQPRIVRTGALTVDLTARRVLVDGIETFVSGREWDVLAYLAKRVGQWCSCDDIQIAVWGQESATRRRKARADRLGTYRPDLRPVNVTVDRLRKRLGTAGRLITSVPAHDNAGRRLDLEPPL